jgi:hypothetical protein
MGWELQRAGSYGPVCGREAQLAWSIGFCLDAQNIRQQKGFLDYCEQLSFPYYINIEVKPRDGSDLP